MSRELWAQTLFARVVACGCYALTGVVAAGCTSGTAADPLGRSAAEPRLAGDEAAKFPTTTPIKHVVVIFGENISFDHYFGTYPRAENKDGEPIFNAAPDTPTANNLETPLDPVNDFASVTGLNLLGANPNFINVDNVPDAANPLRLGPAHATTQGMVHHYTPEQRAAHGGAMDLFPKFTGSPGVPLPGLPEAESRGLVMAYFDGNTVSALWNFAQAFAMNDNSWTSTFGPSTPGAINLISGQTNGFAAVNDFFRALKAGNFPAVSYLKAAAFEDGHAGYSNPLDEQNFILEVVKAVQASPEWSSTAIILAYDDSDGWYDHQAPPIVNPSNGAADALNGEGFCNDAGAQQRGPAPLSPLHGHDGKPALGRCGYGTRVPLLVVSPFAIDHTLTDQTSILRFIEDNWLGGERIQPGGSFDTIAGTLENLFQF